MAPNQTQSDGPPWEELSSQQTLPKRGIFILIDGPEGTGKTTLALTLAKVGPIGYVDIDQSVDRAKRPDMPKNCRFQARTIAVRYKGGLGPMAQKSCKIAWKKIKRGALGFIEWAKGGIIIDTGSEAWEILRLGAFGTLTPRGNTKSLYGPVNAEFRQWIRNIHRHGMRHLIFVNQMKDEWKNNEEGVGEKTGRLERVGWRDLGYASDMILQTRKVKGKFTVKVKVCKLAPNGPALEGTVFEDDDFDLIHILTVATATERSDWVK